MRRGALVDGASRQLIFRTRLAPAVCLPSRLRRSSTRCSSSRTRFSRSSTNCVSSNCSNPGGFTTWSRASRGIGPRGRKYLLGRSNLRPSPSNRSSEAVANPGHSEARRTRLADTGVGEYVDHLVQDVGLGFEPDDAGLRGRPQGLPPASVDVDDDSDESVEPREEARKNAEWVNHNCVVVVAEDHGTADSNGEPLGRDGHQVAEGTGHEGVRS